MVFGPYFLGSVGDGVIYDLDICYIPLTINGDLPTAPADFVFQFPARVSQGSPLGALGNPLRVAVIRSPYPVFNSVLDFFLQFPDVDSARGVGGVERHEGIYALGCRPEISRALKLCAQFAS
jgi:hypothetical protein